VKLTLLALCGLSLVACGGAPATQPPPAAEATPAAKTMEARVEKSDFGKTADGTAVDLYTMTNAKGMVVKFITFGGIITELHVPDRDGKLADIVLGFKTIDGYLGSHPYFGALVGRVGNRIAKGRFTLDGKQYTLATNDNKTHHLHGGLVGFDKKVWRAEQVPATDGVAVKLTLVSPDGDEGYPGNLTAVVVYTLTNANELVLDYTATADKRTPANLTSHSYFNLAGDGSGDILGHEVMLAADKITATDKMLIPTGEIVPVAGTPFDFTTPTVIGARINEVPAAPPGGYDTNYVLTSGGGTLALAARVREPKTGRVMEISTTEPGIQFYTGNFLDGTLTGKAGAPYRKHAGFCLETQHFPDAVHHKNFPTTILEPGKPYTSRTVHRFSTY
jgi:aldose 1-epimerase